MKRCLRPNSATERGPPRLPPIPVPFRRCGQLSVALYVVAIVPKVGMFDAALRAADAVSVATTATTSYPRVSQELRG